jgi:hypothetical protein
MSSQPFFTTPSPAAQKLEALRQLFPQAVEVDDKGGVRVNPAAIQMALDPGNPAGVCGWRKTATSCAGSASARPITKPLCPPTK